MDSVKIYKLAENMTDAEYEKKYSQLTEKQKLSVQSLIRLGDTPKLALATTLLNKDNDSENSETWNLYKYAKGSTVEGGFDEKAYHLEERAKKQLGVGIGISDINKALKRYENENSQNAVYQSNKLRQLKSEMEALILHYEDETKYAKGGGTKKRSLMSMANLVDWKGEGIKKWYIRSYPTDELGEELNDDVTFRDLMDALNNKQDVYEVMGVADSVVRERLFEYLSLVYDVDYDVVYKKWLSSNDYAQGGATKGFNYSIGGL